MQKLTLLAALLLLTPVASHAKTLEDLLVEKGVVTKGEMKDTKGSAGAPAKVYWNDGTRVEFPDNGFDVKINSFIQTRYTFSDFDAGSNTSSFDVNIARVMLSGNALHNEFSYMLNGDFVGDQSGAAKSPALLDAYIIWQGCDWAKLQMGQFKTGVSRQFNSDEHSLQFADESLVSQYYNLGRQSGLHGSWDLADGALAIGAGIFNGISTGEGINRSGVDTKHTGIVNVRWNAMGKQDVYEESDLNWTEDPALSIGAAYAYSDYNNAGVDSGSNLINVDAEFKYSGWSLNAELYNRATEPDDLDDAKDEPTGFYASLGYFIDPKKTELAARYGYLDCDNGKAGGVCSGNDNLNTVDVTLNYYFWKNNLKAQLGYSIVNTSSEDSSVSDTNDNRWLVQLSSYF